MVGPPFDGLGYRVAPCQEMTTHRSVRSESLGWRQASSRSFLWPRYSVHLPDGSPVGISLSGWLLFCASPLGTLSYGALPGQVVWEGRPDTATGDAPP